MTQREMLFLVVGVLLAFAPAARFMICSKHSLRPRIGVVQASGAAYFVGPMQMGSCSGSTGRLLLTQTTGYELRIGLFDV